MPLLTDIDLRLASLGRIDGILVRTDGAPSRALASTASRWGGIDPVIVDEHELERSVFEITS